jgi:hypothetical protein
MGSDMVKAIGSYRIQNHVAQWDNENTIKGGGFLTTEIARLPVAQTFTALKTFETGIRLGVSPTTLTYYEEALFTPTLAFNGTANGMTFQSSGQIGRFVRIGRIVSAWITLRLSAVGSSVGNAYVGNLPYPTINHFNLRHPATIAVGGMAFTGVMQGICVHNTTEIALQICNNGVTINAPNTAFTNTTVLYINLTYETSTL